MAIITLPGWLENPYLQFIAIIVLGVIAASLVHLFLRTVVKKLTEKTQTDLDDLILNIIIQPIYILLIAAAAHVAVKVVQTQARTFAWIDTVFFIIYTLVFASTISRILSLLITRWFAHHKQVEKTPKLPGKIVSVIVFIIAFIIILDHFDIAITPFITALGIGGLAVGLALQNTLSNLFAGLHLISDEPVKVGEFVELDGSVNVAGTVEDIGWRSTRIKTLANNIIVIPNAKLADSVIINDTQGNKEMGVTIKCGVAYDSDLEKVERVVETVAKKVQKSVQGAVASHEPVMRFTAFGDSNIEFETYLRAETYLDRALIKHAFITQLKPALDKAGIEIAYPTRTLRMHTGHMHTPKRRNAR